MNDLGLIIIEDFTHKKTSSFTSTHFSQSQQQIMFSLQLSSHVKHYQPSLHASSLCSILSFPRVYLLFGFNLICVYVSFCLVLLFTVPLARHMLCDSSPTVHIPLEKIISYCYLHVLLLTI